jgi:hypothetical protein
VLSAGELNAYDVLVSDWLIFTKATLPTDSPAATEPGPAETTVAVGSEPNRDEDATDA